MKYESPFIEVVKFSFKTNVLAASNTKNENTVVKPTGGVGLPDDDLDLAGIWD